MTWARGAGDLGFFFFFGIILLYVSAEFSSRLDYPFFKIGKLVWDSPDLNFHVLYSNFLPGSGS